MYIIIYIYVNIFLKLFLYFLLRKQAYTKNYSFRSPLCTLRLLWQLKQKAGCVASQSFQGCGQLSQTPECPRRPEVTHEYSPSTTAGVNKKGHLKDDP